MIILLVGILVGEITKRETPCQMIQLNTSYPLQGDAIIMRWSFILSLKSERQLERVLGEISATTDSPLVFKLLEDLKVVHMTRRPEVSCGKPRKVNPKRRSLSAGAPIKEHNPLRERRCQSVIPSGKA